MIRNMAQLDDGASLHADVGIVGAGIAGIELARRLGRIGLRVVLLESGRLEFDPATQALARVTSAGKPLRTHETHGHLSEFLPPMYRGLCRLRQFGGLTNVWTGKWRRFASLDIEERPWVPHSGWPIALNELLPYYEEVGADYGLGDFDATWESDIVRTARRRLAPAGLEPHIFYWEKSPTRPGDRFFQELKAAATIDVVLGATATELVLSDNLERVESVVARSLDGRRCSLRARFVVLATGGLEVPRLLLVSDRQLPGGIGNRHDLVGRFFMDHPKYMGALLRPSRTLARLADGVRSHPRPRFAMSFGLSEQEQREHALLNHAVSIRHPVRHFGRGPVAHYLVNLLLEQAPNRESRAYIGATRDAVGMRQLVVDWRFTPLDHSSLAALVPRLTRAFAEAGLGCLDFRTPSLDMDDMVDASHHMGTTRMAAESADGVVDRDCRVFGTKNLFVASSSVFPTGHSYSPTYTILALARRLMHHLERMCAQRPSIRPAVVRARPGTAGSPVDISAPASESRSDGALEQSPRHRIPERALPGEQDDRERREP